MNGTAAWRGAERSVAAWRGLAAAITARSHTQKDAVGDISSAIKLVRERGSAGARNEFLKREYRELVPSACRSHRYISEFDMLEAGSLLQNVGVKGGGRGGRGRGRGAKKGGREGRRDLRELGVKIGIREGRGQKVSQGRRGGAGVILSVRPSADQPFARDGK